MYDPWKDNIFPNLTRILKKVRNLGIAPSMKNRASVTATVHYDLKTKVFSSHTSKVKF